MSSRFFPFALILGILAVLSFTIPTSYAQQTDAGDTGMGQLNLGNLFQGGEIGINEYYYIDQMSMQLARESPALEKFINPATYELGPYDLLSIEAEGNFSLRLRGVTVNAQGDLILPTAGKISVNHLTIKQAEEKIQQQLRKEFKNFDVSVSLDQPRPITIHLSGNITNPGNYLLPAGTRLGTLFKNPAAKIKTRKSNVQRKREQLALPKDYQSIELKNFRIQPSSNILQQGLSYRDSLWLKAQNYDLRNITIKRSDTTIHADLIAYLRGGITSANPFLQDGDRIIVDRKVESTPRISISGAVMSPVELTYNPSDSIEKLLKIAGGFTPVADSTKALIYRTGKSENPIHVDLQDTTEFTLKPNDRIVIPYKRKDLNTHSAWVHGEVQIPGNFPIQDESTTIQELLNRAGGLTKNALEHGAYLVRSQEFGQEMPSVTRFDPMDISRTSNMLLQGYDYLKMERAIGHNRVPVNLNNLEELRNLKISDGDHLYIPRDPGSVILFGQLNNPGYYSFEKGLTVDQYIRRAGGLAMGADENEIYIIKAGSRAWHRPHETELQSGDIIFVNRTPFQDYVAKRNFRQDRMRLILSAISAVTAIITTTVAITQ